MMKNEFARLVSIIKSGFRAPWLDQEDICTAFYNYCVQYDFDTCKTAIIDLVENGNGTEPVTMAVVERKIEHEARIRKKPVLRQNNVCPKCGGKGYILKTYLSCAEYLNPCDCSIGRDMYPSYFWSEDEEEAYRMDQSRRGINIPRYVRASQEFHRSMKYGGIN